MIHGSMSGASNQIEQALRDARDSGQMMSAVWFVDDKGKLICRKTTWQFPIGRLEEAKQMLGKMIDDELNPVKAPLPLAAFLSPRPLDQNKMEGLPIPVIDDSTEGRLESAPAVFDGSSFPPIVNAVVPLDSEDGE